MSTYKRAFRYWIPAEEERLVELVEAHHSYKFIASKLRRTVTAIRIRLQRSLHTSLTDPENGAQSMRKTALRLGMRYEAMRSFIRHGWLVAQPGSQVQLVEDEALLRFLENPDHWHNWDPQRITDPDLKEWAIDLRRGVAFLSVKEAARQLMIAETTIDDWIRSGDLRVVKAYNGYRFIRSDWLKDTPVPGAIRNATGKRRPFTADEIGFIRVWRSFQPISYLAKALKRAYWSVAWKCERLGLIGPTLQSVNNRRQLAEAA
jgi:excisionase family DNA binding protein